MRAAVFITSNLTRSYFSDIIIEAVLLSGRLVRTRTVYVTSFTQLRKSVQFSAKLRPCFVDVLQIKKIGGLHVGKFPIFPSGIEISVSYFGNRVPRDDH